MSVEKCQEETTSVEFIQWIKYLDDDFKEIKKQDFYLAQIAAEIRRGNVKHPERVKIDDFLLKFKTSKEETNISKEEKMENSKRFWFATLGIKKKDN